MASSTPRKARLTAALIVFAIVLLTAGSAHAGRLWTNRRQKDGPPGNLGVLSFKLYEVGIGGSRHQVLARVLIENQSPLDRRDPYRVVVIREPEGERRRRRSDDVQILGSCGGNVLPRGQVAVCDIWLGGGSVGEGEEIRAVLDRSIESFDIWDGDPGNDERAAALRTIPVGDDPLRIATWDVQPRILHGMGEIQFRFTVEGAHLVWLLSDAEEEPRLVAGHPADGLLPGQGTVRIRNSGPLTLVARNTLGAFVYQTIPVLNSYQPPQPSWVDKAVSGPGSEAVARILAPGVYEEDDNVVILANLESYLKSKDWVVELERLRRLGEDDRPRPASVLNPKARDR